MDLGQVGFPKVKLAALPTPFEEAPRFAQAIGPARVFLKRDDATLLGMGGNKARKLELLVGEALAEKCDTLVTCGGPQSNHARMTAAAARKFDLEPVLVLDGDDPGVRQGNLLLDHLMGARLIFSSKRDSADVLPEVAESLRKEGKHPYLIPMGGSNALGTLGYVGCIKELVYQTKETGICVKALYLAAGSCGTLAGAILGKILFGAEFDVIGVAVSPSASEKKGTTIRLVTEASRLLSSRIEEKLSSGALSTSASLELAELLDNLSRVTPQAVEALVEVNDREIGPGYAIPSPEGMEAISLLAKNEGVFADPVYTGKALAGLVGDVRSGRYGPGDSVVFLHTGGAPADFAYAEAFMGGGGAKS